MPLSYNIAFSVDSGQYRLSHIIQSGRSYTWPLQIRAGGVHVVQTSSGVGVFSLKRENSAISSLLWTGSSHGEFTLADSQGYIVTVCATDEVGHLVYLQ